MNNRSYADYQTIVNAHRVAFERNWISRIGYDQARNEYWIEYVGRLAAI